MKIIYKEKRFRGPTKDLIDQANEIIEEYAAQGFDLTLRQLYYQFVARDLFPEDRRWRRVTATGKWVRDPDGTKNADPNYTWLGGILNDGRLAGCVDWDCIVDRTRNLRKLGSWRTPAEYIMPNSFHLDMWKTQKEYCEVWIEKEALVGVIVDVCRRWDVPYFACRGYVSQSESWRAGQRIARRISIGKKATVFHLGDHDPSGIDMTRDNRDRCEMFDALGVDVQRLALNMDQVEKWNPPPNPAKLTDSRCKGYIDKYGDQSWELDALEPREIKKLIEANIKKLIDVETWKARAEEQARGQILLGKVQDRWDDVVSFLNA